MRLKVLRTAKGFTREALAETIHVNPRQIRAWEYGEREPRIRELILLADALECTVDQLIRPAEGGDDGI